MIKPRLIQTLSHFLRWSIFFATILFLGIAIFENWKEVRQLRLHTSAIPLIAIALLINLISHLGLGIVWAWILNALKYSVSWYWALITFAIVEVAKYLPGNIWQIYGRIQFAKDAGVPVAAGAVSIILESTYLTMAAAALGLLLTAQPTFQVFSAVGLLVMLVVVHPQLLNLLLRKLSRIQLSSAWLKQTQSTPVSPPLTEITTGSLPTITGYPTIVLVGITGLMGLRAVSFLCIVAAFSPLNWRVDGSVVAGFSVAWVIGIVTPGISGGVGLFEWMTLNLLQGVLPSSIILWSVIIYRLLNTLTEAIAAGLGGLLKGRRTLSELSQTHRCPQ